MTRRRAAASMLGLGAGLALAGCGIIPERPKPAIPLVGDNRLEEMFIDVSREKSSQLVADATDFEWDRFQIFPVGTPGEEINEAAGVTVVATELYTGSDNLFIFALDGVAVHGHATNRETFTHPYLGIWFGPLTEVYSAPKVILGFRDPSAPVTMEEAGSPPERQPDQYGGHD